MISTGTVETNGTLLKQQLLDLAGRYLAVAAGDEVEQRERETRLQPLLTALTTGIFRVVVMGEIKKGKSSFINALLGLNDLLPIDTDVATSTVYKLVYGPVEKYTVFFLPADGGVTAASDPLEINKECLHEFGTEQGNPGNPRHVAFIAIELSHPLLKEGMAIVDTPGVGGLFKQHRDITFEYAPNADVVFFILDSVETVISDDEVRFVKELQKNTRQIVFLQTKIDIAGEEQVQAWRARNLSVLEQALGVEAKRIPYFLVSAKLKQSADHNRCTEDLNDSGYLPVLQLLQKVLIPRRDAIVADRWTKGLAVDVAAAGQLVADRLAIAQETNKPKLAEYEAQLTKAEQDFDSWQNERWPRTFKSFQDETGRLKRETRNRLQDALSPESAGFRAVIDYIGSNCKTAEQVAESTDEILSTHAARCNQESNTILSEFRNSYSEKYQDAIGAAIEDLRLIAIPAFEAGKGDSRRETASVLPAWREALMNANVFGGFARASAGKVGFAVGIATMLGLISNPIGITVVASAAIASVGISIWSAVRGYKLARERQLAAALGNLERAMAKTAQTAARSAQRALDEIIAELDSKARDGFDSFRADFKSDFTKRKRELLAARSRTEAETKQAVASLKGHLEAHASVLTNVQAIAAKLSGG